MAAPPLEVKVRGVRQLQAGAARLFRNIQGATDRDAAKATADQTAASIRSAVPRLTGRLAASVRAEQHGNRASVTMGAGLPYARWIEYRDGVAQGRYVYPTAKRGEGAFRNRAENVTGREIRSMHWPTPH